MTGGGHLSSARGGFWARPAARLAGVRARCGARAGPRARCLLARCWAGAGPRQSALLGRDGAWAAGDASAGGVLRAGRALVLGRCRAAGGAASWAASCSRARFAFHFSSPSFIRFLISAKSILQPLDSLIA
jgi:hypothetical protein